MKSWFKYENISFGIYQYKHVVQLPSPDNDLFQMIHVDDTIVKCAKKYDMLNEIA